MGPITRFDLEGSPYDRGGQVGDFPGLPFEESGLSLGAQFAAEAAAMALVDFPPEGTPELACVLATNFGPAELFEDALGEGKYSGPGAYRLSGGFFAEEAQRVAYRMGIGGPAVSISLSCASGNAAILHALDLVRSGRAAADLACGYDSIQRLSWAGLACLRVMALPSEGGPAEVRPFDEHRAGTLFSEGAACLLIESEDSARGRGAELLAEVAGAGANNNAYHLTHADTQGGGMATALRMALDDAGVGPDEVDHYNAHGTGTKLNDVIETRALQLVLGERAERIPVVSNKGGLGHGMGAASSFEAVASVMSLRTGVVPPTVNHSERAADCPLDVVSGEARQAEIAAVLSNAAGIGGANAAVLFRRAADGPSGERPSSGGGEG